MFFSRSGLGHGCERQSTVSRALRVKCKSSLFVTVALIVGLHECTLVGPRTEMSTCKY